MLVSFSCIEVMKLSPTNNDVTHYLQCFGDTKASDGIDVGIILNNGTEVSLLE